MNLPLISVILPTHNNAKTIERAIKSITNQTYANLEIIIVDDQSTDTTADIVQNFSKMDSRVRYYLLEENDPFRYDSRLKRNINAGYSARNFGFTKARGSYITFQDADDASLLNRIEIQYALLMEHNAIHLCLDYVPLQEKYLGKSIDSEAYQREHPNILSNAKSVYELSQRTKGIFAKLLPGINSRIPFHLKRLRILNHLFFGSLEPYPGAGNSPLFSADVLKKVQFRRLRDRVWPSFMGRGADRDFNFQVAETFRNSYVVRIPAYLWDTHSIEGTSPIIEKYLV